MSRLFHQTSIPPSVKDERKSIASGHGQSTLPLTIAAAFEGRPVAAFVGDGGGVGPPAAEVSLRKRQLRITRSQVKP